MRRSIVIAIVGCAGFALACTRPPPIAPTAAPSIDPVVEVAPPPAPAPIALPPLTASPSHRVLTWFVDAIAHRKGEVTRDEIAEHCDRGFLGPTAHTAESFQTWAKQADGAVLATLEVDDATYASGTLATADHRWKFIMNFDADGKLSYLRFGDAR